MTSLVDRFWARADNEYGTAGGIALRDRYELRQQARFIHGHESGFTSRGGTPAGANTPWVSERMTVRTAAAGLDVASTVGAVRSAWNSVESLQEAAARRDGVAAVADGPDNTGSIDWARQP